DAYQVSTGFPDQRLSVNSARVVNRGWTKEDSVSIMQPAWFMVRGPLTPNGMHIDTPSDVLDLTESGMLGATADPGAWPVANTDEELTTGTLSWYDDDDNLLLFGECRHYPYGATSPNVLVDSDDAELNFVDVVDLPLDGNW